MLSQLSYMGSDSLCRVLPVVTWLTINPVDILDDMYVPAHFAANEQAVDDLPTHHGAADLITATLEDGVATMLHFVYDPGSRSLRGHLARNNDQWRRSVVGEALVIVR